MATINNIDDLLEKVKQVSDNNQLDLSSDEDLSIAIMNLISIEEHLFFTAQKTDKKVYLDLLDEVRQMRKDLLKRIIKDYEGEVWCISKHLLASSMRLIEVGTKELAKKHQEEAADLFKKAYQLYSLFWGINLKIVKVDEIKPADKVELINDHNNKTSSVALFDKLGEIVKKAVDCCKE